MKSFRPALFSFVCIFAIQYSAAQSGAWLSHSHDAQHSGVSSVASQSLSKIHWQTPVDLAPPSGEIFIHYGSPLVTAANTVIVPVKTGTNSFRVEAHDGATGTKLWQIGTGYTAPSTGFLSGLGPTISGNRLFIPDSGGRILVRKDPDQATAAVSRLYFYGAKNYQAAPLTYQQNIQISTPLTTDAKGTLFFGFLANGTTPIGLQSGLARIAADGTGTWV